MLKIFLVLFPVFLRITCTLNNTDKTQLIAVIALYRHGARSPIISFPNDEFFHSSYWPMGYGQLTNVGVMEQFKLGQWLRKRYKDFLNKIYTPSEIYVFSTDTDRTLMSAYANLAGLYPPEDFQSWNNQIIWQPIPVHTNERTKDDIVIDKRECKKFDNIYENAKNKKYKIFETKYAELFDYIKEHTGWNNLTLAQVKNLRSNMYAYSHYNRSFIPKWTKYIDQDLLNYLAAVVYELPSTTVTLARLRTGPFFAYLFDYFDTFVVPSSALKSKFLMLSAHDSVLVPVLNAMGAFKMRPVNFSDTIIWELRKAEDGTYFVNLMYKRDNSLEKLNIHECDFDCNYNDFKNRMSEVTIGIEEWLKECNS